MTQVNVAKSALIAAGVLVFFFGIRTGHDILRWTGIALVTLAWLLRFVGRAPRLDQTPTSPTEDSR